MKEGNSFVQKYTQTIIGPLSVTRAHIYWYLNIIDPNIVLQTKNLIGAAGVFFCQPNNTCIPPHTCVCVAGLSGRWFVILQTTSWATELYYFVTPSDSSTEYRTDRLSAHF